MKRLLLSCATLCAAVAASADDYVGTLLVNVDGTAATPSLSKIVINKQTDGKYELQLNDFTLTLDGETMYVGSIRLKDVAGQEEDGCVTLSSTQNIEISEGSYSSVDGQYVMWLGPLLSADGGIDVSLTAELLENGKFMTAEIGIPFSGMDISVAFDSQNYQLPNSTFDAWHTLSEGFAEPDYFHSFATADGELASVVSPTNKISQSADVRSGVDGSCIRIWSNAVGNISANGTVTNGRLTAGSATATSPLNHAYLDLSSTATDAKGYPFGTYFVGTPDSLELWVNYHVGKRDVSNKNNVYASLNAVLTDGSYYQDPEDKTYDNVLGRAAAQIEDTHGEWVRISVPFKYDDVQNKELSPRALLFTASTCSVAGGGSKDSEDPDVLLLDDLRFTYSSKAKAVYIGGVRAKNFAPNVETCTVGLNEMPSIDDIEVEGVNPSINYDIRLDEDNKLIYVTVTSQDLLSTTQYILEVVDPASGIDGKNVDLIPTKKIYNLSGQQIDASTLRKGEIYIEQYSNGKTIKRIR